MPVRLTVTLENGEERQENIGVGVWLDGEKSVGVAQQANPWHKSLR